MSSPLSRCVLVLVIEITLVILTYIQDNMGHDENGGKFVLFDDR